MDDIIKFGLWIRENNTLKKYDVLKIRYCLNKNGKTFIKMECGELLIINISLAAFSRLFPIGFFYRLNRNCIIKRVNFINYYIANSNNERLNKVS
jgi:hypothetical protein